MSARVCSRVSLLRSPETISPAQAFKLGVGWLMVSPKQWALMLTAVVVIYTAYLPPVASAVNFFIFTLLVQTIFFVIIGFHVLMPEQSEKILDAVFVWLKKHLIAVAIGIFGIFGLFFLIKGIIGLVD